MSATHSVLIYGKTKIGKSSDLAYGYHLKGECRALFVVTEPGALDPVKANWGFEPTEVEFLGNSGADLINVAAGPVMDHLRTGKYMAVVFDSLTAFCQRVLSKHTQNPKNKEDARKVYPKVADEVLTAVDVCLTLPTTVFFLCHEQPLKTTEGGALRYVGGPNLPGALTELIPGRVRTVLRAHKRDGKRIYSCDPDDVRWMMADSYACAKKEQELDIRPIMYRMYGMAIPENLEPKVYKEVL